MKRKWIISSVSLLLAIVVGVTVFQEITRPTPPTQATEQVQATPVEVAPEEPAPPVQPEPVKYTLNTDEIFTLVNKEREKVGLKPLIRDARLDASAAAKCNDMVTRNYWSHADPDGVMPWHFMVEQGVTYSTAGENLAKDYVTSLGVVSGWMKSEGHKANILSTNFEESGVAVCDGGGTITYLGVAVQHFAAIL